MIHKIRFLCVALAALVLATGPASAQTGDPRQIVVPLSSPGRPAVLEVSTIDGTIHVEGYDGSEIVIAATEVVDERDRDERRKDGMRRLPNTGLGLTIEERDNHVEVSTDWTSSEVLMRIRVPRKTSVRIDCVNGEDIEIAGVEGEHELSHTNGAIKAVDVRGSLVADTTNGDVVVKFLGVTPDKAMSFSSFNGDVDVTLPSVAKARLRIKSGQGEILTDFDVALDASPPRVTREEGRKGYRLKLEREVIGTINGGGAELTFTTYNGDVYIRKMK